MEIVFRILWSVVLGGLIYGSAIWLLRVELSGDIERMEPGKAWLLGGLARSEEHTSELQSLA